MANNIKFQEPLFSQQSLANGFLYGEINLSEDSYILLSDGYKIPTRISENVIAKATEKGINLSAKCFCGVYPKFTTDNIQVVEISTIYGNESLPELLDRFRIRGEIISCGISSLEIVITPVKSEDFLVTLEINQANRFSAGQFIEVLACRIYDKLVVYSDRVL
jgi:hypothetical protein